MASKSPLSALLKNKFFRYTSFGVLVIFAIVFAALVGFYLSVYFGYFGEVPSKYELQNIRNAVATEVYSEDSVLLGRYYIQNRTHIDFDNISPNVVNALVATEDVRFYKHGGIDFQSMFRVLIKTLMAGDESSGGGSTISQQLSKNLYPRQTYERLSLPINKMREMIIAQRLEDIYDKNDILKLYLNTVPFSDNTYGIQVAGKRFFNTEAPDLNIEQAAMLVGMLKANGTYNPRTNPKRSLSRRNTVIEQMQKYGFLTVAQADSVKKTPLSLNYRTDNNNDGIATYFREFLRSELKEWAKKRYNSKGKPYNIYTDGLKVYTTINSKMQVYAEEAVTTHLAKLQKDFDEHWKGKKPWGTDEYLEQLKKRTPRYKSLKSQGKTEKQITKIFDTPIPMTIFSWNGDTTVTMSPIDSVKHYYSMLNTGFMVNDPKTGEVKAWVGGTNFKHFKFDHVLSSRQVGSTFKPLVYLSAIEKGISPCTYVPNQKIYYKKYKWAPKNSDHKYGGYYSLSGALRRSMNTVTVQLLMHVGTDYVIDLAKRMGMKGDFGPYPSMALGVPDISLMDMIKMYSVLANRGERNEMKYIKRIETQDGKVFDMQKKHIKPVQVVKEEDADRMTRMLMTVVDSGTARRLRFRYKFENQIAGKTGTTQRQSDGWFMGYTPNLVAGAWVGGEEPSVRFRTIRLGQGANMALPIWALFMKKVYADSAFVHLSKEEFPELDSLSLASISCRSRRSYRPANVLHRRYILINEEIKLEPDSIEFYKEPETDESTVDVEEIEKDEDEYSNAKPEDEEKKVKIPGKEEQLKKGEKELTKKQKEELYEEQMAALREARKKAKKKKEKAERKVERKKKRKKFWNKVWGRKGKNKEEKKEEKKDKE